MIIRTLILVTIAAGVLGIAGAAYAASDCSDLISLPGQGTLRRCTAADGTSYCVLCKDGKCTRTSCARPGVGGN